MKKTNFMKGLTLAAVALVSVFTTSCSEEELSISNPGSNMELPAATASVSISVVDLGNGQLIGNVTTIDATSAIGGTISVDCPANDGYTTAASTTVSIPSISKGQSVNVPVTFYVAKISSALAEIAKTLEKVSESSEAVEEAVATEEDAESFYNKTAYDVKATATFALKSGVEYVGEARTANELADLMKNLTFNTIKGKYNFIIPAWEFATITASQEFTEATYTAEYNGEKKSFIMKEAGPAICSIKYAVIPGCEHDHAHNNHGHGDSSNAGGGIIEAE